MNPTIDELPNEVLRIILSYVTHRLDQKRVSLVSHHFRDVMRTISRHNFKLNLESNPHAEFRDCSEFPFTSIDFGLYEVEKFQHCLDDWKLFGESISEVSIKLEASDFPQLLEHLSTHMPNLKILKLSQNALDRTTRKKLKMKNASFLSEKQFLFPRVDTLDLSQGKCSSDVANYLVQCCPNLKRLILSDEMSDFVEEKFCQFLHKWTSEGIKIVFHLQTTNITPLLNAPTENFRIECFKVHPRMKKLQEFFTSPREIGTLTVHIIAKISFRIFETMFRNEGTYDRLFVGSGLPIDGLPLVAESRAVKSLDLRLGRTFQPSILTRELATKVTDFSLELSISESEIINTCARLQYVKKLRLSSEDANETQFSNEIFQAVYERMTALKEFEISYYGFCMFSNSFFRGISNLKHLERFYIADFACSLTEAIFKDFQLPKLKELQMSVKKLSLQGLRILARNCPNIETLEIFSRFKGDKIEDLQTFVMENFRYIRKKRIE